ncbi:MAG TPA: hypothetical protein VFG86_19560, partial [Chloroflexota bacterium]|nr:hypothetical protein [Chloroflexota bacterium]
WFTDPIYHASDFSLVFSSRTGLALGAAVVAVAVFWVLQRLLGDAWFPRLPIFERMAEGDVRLLSVQTAITLIYMAVRLALLSPHLSLPQSPLGYVVAGLQLAIAFSFIARLFDRWAASLLILMGLLVTVLFSPLDALQLAYYGGIGALLLISGVGRRASRPLPPVDEPVWGQRAIFTLRVLAGLAFLCIALGDKIWNPDLGAAFLQKYPHFNVLRLAGLDVSDEAFALGAGVIETAAGALLLSGLLTRVVIAVLLVPFNLTVPFLPAEEMIGHLPIFGILYVLLVHGPGRLRAEPADGRGTQAPPPA